MFKPTVYKNTAKKAPDPIIIDQFRGVDFSSNQTQVALNRAIDAPNMLPDGMYFPNKRTGIKKVLSASLGPGGINGIHLYTTINNTVQRLLHHGTKLYYWRNDDTLVELRSDMNNAKSRSFSMNNKLYILDGTNYWQYTSDSSVGTTGSVAGYAYVPTLFKDGKSGREPFENFNLIGRYFKESFSSDGTSTTYQLSLNGLDPLTVYASFDMGVNFDLREGLNLTVDRELGLVTFTDPPPAGTNTLVIRAAKTIPSLTDRIDKCTIAALFGGTNDTRVFLSGNPDYPNTDWRSGLYDPTYFPEHGFTNIGSNNVRIMGYKKQSNALMIIKEDSQQDTTTFLRTFQLNSDGTVSFPLIQGTTGTGCIAKDSIQSIEDKPFFISKTGAHCLNSTNVADERNTSHKSKLIDTRLLAEPNLENAVTVEYNRQYWIAVNGNVYVMNEDMKYTDENGEIQYEWFFLNGIKASCFLEYNNYLYFGDSTQGMLWRFKKPSEVDAYIDDVSTPITAYWTTPLSNLGTYAYYKTIKNVLVTMMPGDRTSADVYYNSSDALMQISASESMALLDWDDIDWDDMSWETSSMPQIIATNTKERKVPFFGVTVKNDKLGESFGIYAIQIVFDFMSPIK